MTATVSVAFFTVLIVTAINTVKNARPATCATTLTGHREIAAEALRAAADQAAEAMAAQFAEMTEQLADAQARVTAAEEAAAAVEWVEADRDRSVADAERRADTAIERVRHQSRTGCLRVCNSRRVRRLAAKVPLSRWGLAQGLRS